LSVAHPFFHEKPSWRLRDEDVKQNASCKSEPKMDSEQKFLVGFPKLEEQAGKKGSSRVTCSDESGHDRFVLGLNKVYRVCVAQAYFQMEKSHNEKPNRLKN